ncbi:unnamed protein product [Mytilus edulis]|uniref:Chitin-binding type-2 domain-containing protein n=1 Tax=Mytilus edulis TaxID=6550 RepID=A0A8S3S2F1_MYTED|nr:unnamed protein product [Mytilus edulis]
MYENVVYYHSPRHGNTSESHRMQDFNTGLEISCSPTEQKCYLGQINRSSYPDAATVITSVALMWKQGINSIQSEKALTVHHGFILNGTEITDLVFLSTQLRDFVTKLNYPLYPIVPLPKDAEFITGEFKDSNRNKRQLTDAHPCSDGSNAKQKYGYTEGNCDHLYFCKGGTGSNFNCASHHVYGIQYYTCVCCPEATRISQCGGCHKNVFAS